MADSSLPPLDDWGPNKTERQIIGWALASPIHTIYYKAKHRLQPHAIFRSLADREPLITGMDVLWALQALEEHGILDKGSGAAYSLTELGRQVGTDWALGD